MTHVLADGGSALVAVVAACTINLRMVLYSASLAPHLAGERLGRRLIAAYVLTDQAYAVSITRWGDDDDPDVRFAFFIGAGFLLWGVWQVSTLIGVLIGGALPEWLHLDFAIPLVFLVLLVPTITDRPSVVAAVAGGAGAVIGAELGVGDLSILTGALAASSPESSLSDTGTARPLGRVRCWPGRSTGDRSMDRSCVCGARDVRHARVFLVFAHRMAEVPPWLRRVLRQIPPAALASLVAPALLRPEGHIDLFQGRLWAGAVAAFVAWRTRNIAITLVVGMGLLILIDQL